MVLRDAAEAVLRPEQRGQAHAAHLADHVGGVGEIARDRRGMGEQTHPAAREQGAQAPRQHLEAGADAGHARAGSSTTPPPTTESSPSWLCASCSISTRCRPSSTRLPVTRPSMIR